MKAADIYCFSGTGNTLLAARTMRDRLDAMGVEVRLRALDRCTPADVDPDRALGVACAVAMQSTYPPVWRFLHDLPEAAGTPAFLLDTLQMFSGGLVGPVRRLLQRKGYDPIGAVEIRMPGNFRRARADEKADRRRLQAGLKEAETFAEDLVEGTAEWRGPRVGEGMLATLYKLAFAFPGKLRKWTGPTVEPDRCVRCGLCAKLCPVGAIDQRQDQLPAVSLDCIYCMRCFAYCPHEAITLAGRDYVRNHPVTAADFLHGDTPSESR